MLDALGMPGGGGGGQSVLSRSGFSMSSILKHQEDYHRLGKELAEPGALTDLSEESEADTNPLSRDDRSFSTSASGFRHVVRCAMGGLVFLLVVFGIAALFLYIFYLFSGK